MWDLEGILDEFSVENSWLCSSSYFDYFLWMYKNYCSWLSKIKHELNIKLMLSFDGSASEITWYANVMAWYYSIVSHHIGRQINIIQ